MDTHTALVVFQGKGIRRIWNSDEWYFSVIDIIGALTESQDARNYWKVLKHRLSKEGSEVVTKCNQLKLPAADGKLRGLPHTRPEGMFDYSLFCAVQ